MFAKFARKAKTAPVAAPVVTDGPKDFADMDWVERIEAIEEAWYDLGVVNGVIPATNR